MGRKRTVKTVAEIIEYIQEVIKEQKISIMQTEKQSGLSGGAISRWAAGACTPNLYNIVNILNTLNIEIILQLKESPKFLDPVNVILDSKLLNQKIREQLEYKLKGKTAKLAKDILFSDKITSEERKEIYKMLEILIVAQKMREM